MAEWSAAELDHLEDALEGLEQEGALERWLEDPPDSVLPASPALGARLEEYRAVLVASREALPLEEVPPGLLDGVLAEAERAAATPAVTPEAGAKSWWARVRRSFLVPAVALAGTALLVLWLGEPDEVALTEPSATPPAEPMIEVPARARGQAVADEDAAPPPAPVPVPESSVAGEPEEEGEAEAEQSAMLESKVEADEATDDKKPAADPSDVIGGSGSLGNAPGARASPQKTKGAAGPATGRWDIISLGDRARLAGDCVAARDEYAVALEDDEAAVRARAYAGMGLCDAQMGNDPAADANYERARELDGAIGAFLDSQAQRDKPRPKSGSKSKRKKAKPKQKNADQAADPFD